MYSWVHIHVKGLHIMPVGREVNRLEPTGPLSGLEMKQNASVGKSRCKM